MQLRATCSAEQKDFLSQVAAAARTARGCRCKVLRVTATALAFVARLLSLSCFQPRRHEGTKLTRRLTEKREDAEHAPGCDRVQMADVRTWRCIAWFCGWSIFN